MGEELGLLGVRYKKTRQRFNFYEPILSFEKYTDTRQTPASFAFTRAAFPSILIAPEKPIYLEPPLGPRHTTTVGHPFNHPSSLLQQRPKLPPGYRLTTLNPFSCETEEIGADPGWMEVIELLSSSDEEHVVFDYDEEASKGWSEEEEEEEKSDMDVEGSRKRMKAAATAATSTTTAKANAEGGGHRGEDDEAKDYSEEEVARAILMYVDTRKLSRYC